MLGGSWKTPTQKQALLVNGKLHTDAAAEKICGTESCGNIDREPRLKYIIRKGKWRAVSISKEANINVLLPWRLWAKRKEPRLATINYYHVKRRTKTQQAQTERVFIWQRWKRKNNNRKQRRCDGHPAKVCVKRTGAAIRTHWVEELMKKRDFKKITRWKTNQTETPQP